MGSPRNGEVIMGTKSKIEVKILMMDRHFLYLPLYVAQFDHKPSGKLPFYGKIPPQYSVEVVVPPRESDRTDESVFKLLMDDRLGSGDIMFAACDPSAFLRKPDKNALMAASLLTSAAFWAVNHDSGNVRLVADLSSFDRILCYQEGTTSNLIARRIVKNDTDKLHVVAPTQEIPTLEKFGAGTLAISPEPLKIANLIEAQLRPGEERAKIVLDLCAIKEFSNVLTTTLFTRKEVVEKHPELVSGVLIALQCALRAIQADLPMVKDCALYNFRDAFQLDKAMEMAKTGNVFPTTIHVSRDRWQRACEFYYISQAMALGRDKRALTEQEQLKGESLYEQAVLSPDLISLVNNSIKCGLREALVVDFCEQPKNRAIRWGTLLLLAVALLAAGFGAGQIFAATAASGSKIAIGISWVIMVILGWKSGELPGYRKPSSGYLAHWVSFALGWWALHELVVPRFVPDAHFLAGLVLGDALAGGVLTLTSGWIISMGVVMRGKMSKQVEPGSNHQL